MSTLNKIKVGNILYDIEDTQAREELKDKLNKNEMPDISNFATEEYVDNAIANIDIPSGGGNVYSYKQTITSEEEVNGIKIELPANINEHILLNFHFTFPNLETSFTLFSRCGNSYYKNWGDVVKRATGSPGSGANVFILDGQKGSFKTASYPENAHPSMPDTNFGDIPLSDITFYSSTSGVNFPAGTKVYFWGVYSK